MYLKILYRRPFVTFCKRTWLLLIFENLSKLRCRRSTKFLTGCEYTELSYRTTKTNYKELNRTISEANGLLYFD